MTDKKTKDFEPVHNFSSSDCSIINWASLGIDEEQKNRLYQNPLICGTIEINGENYWVWVATTKKEELLKCKHDEEECKHKKLFGRPIGKFPNNNL